MHPAVNGCSPHMRAMDDMDLRWPPLHTPPVVTASDARRLQGEVERLTAWLSKIDGGDDPCTDESTLRQWAFEALVLNREVPA